MHFQTPLSKQPSSVTPRWQAFFYQRDGLLSEERCYSSVRKLATTLARGDVTQVIDDHVSSDINARYQLPLHPHWCMQGTRTRTYNVKVHVTAKRPSTHLTMHCSIAMMFSGGVEPLLHHGTTANVCSADWGT